MTDQEIAKKEAISNTPSVAANANLNIAPPVIKTQASAGEKPTKPKDETKKKETKKSEKKEEKK